MDFKLVASDETPVLKTMFSSGSMKLYPATKQWEVRSVGHLTQDGAHQWGAPLSDDWVEAVGTRLGEHRWRATEARQTE